MKFSFEYVKKNPLLFTMIALVFGVFVLLMLNKGTSTSVATTGPSDAQINAQAALAAKQLDIAGQVQLGGLQISGLAQQGQNDLALAQIAAQVNLANIAAQSHTDEIGVAASLAALTAQLSANVQMNNSNNQFQVDYAKIAADTSLHIVQVNSALQAQLSHDQLTAYTTGAFLSQIGNLKKGDRDAALISLALGAPSSHGSVTGPALGGILNANQVDTNAANILMGNRRPTLSNDNHIFNVLGGGSLMLNSLFG